MIQVFRRIYYYQLHVTSFYTSLLTFRQRDITDVVIILIIVHIIICRRAIVSVTMRENAYSFYTSATSRTKLYFDVGKSRELNNKQNCAWR